MDSSKSKDAHPVKLEAETKVKIGDLRSDAEDDLPEGPQLGVDELCLIFGNYWISAGDLLSCRMVNKNWRDAATTTLLKRNAFCININLDKGNNSSAGQLLSIHKLAQLTKLISNSPKFLTTKFSIDTSSESYADYNSFPDLLQFFKQHRDKIKTLCLHGWTSQKLLMDIFFNFTPSLQCLDLSKVKFWSSKMGKDKSWHSKSKSRILPITSLWLGDSWKDNYYPSSGPNNDPENNTGRNATERPIVHWLMSSPSKLTCIENVTLDTLGGVLREGKGHLIQSFTFTFSKFFKTLTLQMIAQRMSSPMETNLTRLVALKPNLTTVTLDMQYDDEDLLSTADITLVNAFVESIKDTVQDLTFRFKYEAHDWNLKVKIPPMKKLKSITITGNAVDYSMRIGGPFNLRLNFIQFHDGISAQNYFPSLKKISLRFRAHYRDFEDVNLISFFAFKSAKDDGSVWDSLPNVDILETDWEVISCLNAYHGVPEKTLLPEIFPNIRILKIKCEDLFYIETNCWSICPKVEFMEIYGIKRVRELRDDYRKDEDFTLSHYVDRFFTGFPLEICHKLRTTQLPDENNNPDMLKFLQVHPPINELRYLQELKLQFAEPFSSEFGSSTTGEYALKKMPNTKFIISFDSKIFCRTKAPWPSHYWDWEWEWQEGIELDDKASRAAEKLCFGSIKPYVQIVHE